MKWMVLLFLATTPALSDADDVWPILAGGITSLVIHEAGHEIMARATGSSIQWENDKWSCVSLDCDNKSVALGGFTAQAIASHAILTSGTDSTYLKSVVAISALHGVFYAAKNELSGGGVGDFSNFSMGQQRTIELLLVLNAVAIKNKWPIMSDGKYLLFVKQF